MTEEKKIVPDLPPRRILSEARARYTVIDESRIYHFDFPATNTLTQNLDIVSYLKEEIWNAMERLRKEEKEKESKCDCEDKIVKLNDKEE